MKTKYIEYKITNKQTKRFLEGLERKSPDIISEIKNKFTKYFNGDIK